MIPLNVNVKLGPTQRKFIRLENVSTDMLVADLKKEIIAKAGLDTQSTLEILYCCRSLKDESTLKILEGNSSYKMVHAVCVKKSSQSVPSKLTSTEQQQLAVSFRAAVTNPLFRQNLQDASTTSNINDLIATIPGLAEDQVALSMLRDWELLLHLADPKCVQTVADRHPALANAAMKVVSTFQNNVPPGDSQPQRRSNSGWLARSIGADDDEMETEASPAQGASANNPSGGLTPAQFAAALAFVNQSLAGSASTSTVQSTPTRPVTQPSTTSQGTPSATNSILTPAMLTQALFQAMSSVNSNHDGNSRSSSSSSSRNAATSSARPAQNDEESSLREQFGRYLSQMHELGITDDSLSLRALQATNGDVQAAVNLVFAGLVDD